MENQSETDPLIGQVLDGTYQIQRLLGRGGMGTVYEASHRRVQRLFAIKVLNFRYSGKPEALARFKREAMLGSRLGNEHIVQVLDFNQTPEGNPFLVMEFLRGENLAQVLCREQKLELTRAVSIVRQVALALTTAHAEGVVHRDLKPENIFLCRPSGGGEKVKLLEKVNTNVATSDSGLTSDHQILGTPWYMAPEQVTGPSSGVDHRTDIYALGLILYHMLAGQMPYDGDSVPRVLFQVARAEMRPLWELCPDLPGEVIQVVNRATSPHPSGRYQAVEELVDDLEQALGQHWSEVLRLEVGRRPSGAAAAVTGSKAPDDARELGVAPTDPQQAGRGEAGPPPALTTHSRGTGQLIPAGSTRQAVLVRRWPLALVVALLAAGAGALVWWAPGASGPSMGAAPLASADRPSAPGAGDATPEPDHRGPGGADAGSSADSASTAAATRALSVTTTPAGARIFIGGEPAGDAPLSGLQVPQTRLRVEARSAGHQQASRLVPEGQTAVALRLRLRPLPASLNVVAVHGGKTMEAAIHLDGRLVDHTPAVITGLTPGRLRLRVVAAGFRPEQRVVSLAPGQRKVVKVSLVK